MIYRYHVLSVINSMLNTKSTNIILLFTKTPGGIFLHLGIHRHPDGIGISFWPVKYINAWDAMFINLLYQWVDNLACHYINGW
jgi:hypothetical protein